MSDKNIDKDIENIKSFVRSIRSDLEEDAPDNFKLAKSIENVLINLKIKEIENKDLKEKLYIQGNLTETYKKIAEYLARVVIASEYSFLSVEELIDWVREKVEKDETYS